MISDYTYHQRNPQQLDHLIVFFFISMQPGAKNQSKHGIYFQSEMFHLWIVDYDVYCTFLYIHCVCDQKENG